MKLFQLASIMIRITRINWQYYSCSLSIDRLALHWIDFFCGLLLLGRQVVANYYGVSMELVDVPGRRIHWVIPRERSS